MSGKNILLLIEIQYDLHSVVLATLNVNEAIANSFVSRKLLPLLGLNPCNDDLMVCRKNPTPSFAMYIGD